MNRQLSSVTRLAAMAVLVGVAVVACGRPNDATGGRPASSTPAAQQSQAAPVAATLAPTPMSLATDSPATSEATNSATAVATAAPTATAASAATAAAAATADPLDAQLSNLDSLLNGVNGSLSGSDASGGE